MGCDIETVEQMGNAQGQFPLRGGLKAANTDVPQTEESSGQWSFVDSWHAQVAALASESTTVAKESGAGQPAPLLYLQRGAGTKAGEATNRDGLNLIRMQIEPAQVVASTETDNGTRDARVTTDGTAFKRVCGLEGKESRRRSVDGAPISQKTLLSESAPAAQVIPVEVPLPASKPEPIKAEAGSENANKRSSNPESALIAPAALHGSLLSNSALPLAEPVAKLPLRGGNVKASYEQFVGTAESFRADFGTAIQASVNTQAAGKVSDPADEPEIQHELQGGAVIAPIGTGKDAANGQISQSGGQEPDSISLRETNDPSRIQLTASLPGDVRQGAEQNSRDAAQAIPRQQSDESAELQQPHPAGKMDEPGVADRKLKRPETTSGSAIQREEPGKHASVLVAGISAADSTRPLHPEVAGTATVAPARNHAVAIDRPGVQETMNALDAGTGIDSRTLSWTHAGRAHAEAGYQDPALGWVGVRAEISGGAVHATVVPQSAEAAQALWGSLAGLHTYLHENHTPVESLSLAGFGGNAQQSLNHEAGNGAQHGTGEQPGQSNVPDSTRNLGAAGRSIANSVNHASPQAAAHGGRYISVVA